MHFILAIIKVII